MSLPPYNRGDGLRRAKNVRHAILHENAIHHRVIRHAANGTPYVTINATKWRLQQSPIHTAEYQTHGSLE